MTRRILSLIAVLLFLFLAADLAWSYSGQVTEAGNQLVAVNVPSGDALDRFEATGLPIYTRLSDAKGEFILSGADAAGVASLEAAGLTVRVLDADTTGASYYLVYEMPGRPLSDLQAYGQLLLDDGVQFLLRADPADAERLAAAGSELQALTLEPKPMRRATEDGLFPTVLDPDPTIQSMMDQVLSSTVTQYAGGLSGEWPVTIGGQPYTLVTRHTNSGEPIQKATQYVGEHMDNLGLNVEYHQWAGVTYPNVIGEITGESNPDEIYMLTAHLDDMPSGSVAPGADDNASGSMGVLIAADILTQYRWDCTLRFAFFTGEEQGLLGAYEYAERAFNNGENIAGVLNLDMIAWNTPSSSPTIDLHSRASVPGSIDIANLFSDVISTYGVNLIPEIVPNGSGSSDHRAFWDYGFAAILGIEDFSDFNPRYHTVNDLLQYYDIDYTTDFVKAAVGTFATMTGCLIDGGSGALEGFVTEEGSGDPIDGASVDMFGESGFQNTTTTSASGYYTSSLPVGTYTVTVSASGYYSQTITSVDIMTDTVTVQDFELVVIPPDYYLNYLPILFKED